MHRVNSCPSMFLSSQQPDDADGWIKNGRYMLFDDVNSLENLMNFDWYSNPSLIEEVLYCVVNLVSYNACYTTPCFQMLVKSFIPRSQYNEEGEEYYNMEMFNKICDHAHRTCQKIIQIVPLSAPTFYDILQSSYPHKRFNTTIQQVYFRNVLLASQYCPNLQESLLRLAINRLIQVDVDIKLEDLPEDDEDLQFNVEMDKINEAHQLADKLDSLMEIMFDYLDAMLGVNSSPRKSTQEGNSTFSAVHSPSSHDQTFTILLRIFDEVILTTHKSKYTQFLLFYACRIEKRNYMQRFVSHLLSKVMDVSLSPSIRMASAAYAGSFVARARYLPIHLVQDTLLVLSEWAQRYQAAQEQAAPDADMHGLFYMVSQSSFYVFCFHHSTLSRQGNVVAFADPFRHISQSRLNPFKLCLPSVVKEFSRVVSNLRWFAADEIIARNERIFLPTKTSFGSSNQLESFFPFDPYLLRKSSKFISDHYNVWKGGIEEEEDDKTDDESGSESDELMDEQSDGEEITTNSNNTTSMSFTSDADTDLRLGFSLE